MRTVLFVQSIDGFNAGEILEVEDQIACGAIAMGHAVPSIEAPTNAITQPGEVVTLADDTAEVV